APSPVAPLPAPPAPTVAPPPPSMAAPRGPALAAPAVRKLARELDVNIDAVRGSGPSGRVMEEDVRAAKSAPTPAVSIEELPPPRAHTPAGLEERIPIHGLRKRIAEKMAKSHATVAPFTYVEEVDMTQLVHLRDRLKEAAEGKGIKLTYLPFVVKALVAALKEHPTLNASVDDEKQEIVVKRYYNIGIATATAERPRRDPGDDVPVVHVRPPGDRRPRGGRVRAGDREVPRAPRAAVRGTRVIELTRIFGAGTPLL